MFKIHKRIHYSYIERQPRTKRNLREKEYKANLLRFNLQVIQLVYYTFSVLLSCHFNNIFKTTGYFTPRLCYRESIAQEKRLYGFSFFIYNTEFFVKYACTMNCQSRSGSRLCRQQLATIKSTDYIMLSYSHP